MRSPLLLLLPLAASSYALTKPDYDNYDYYAVHLSPDASPDYVAAHLGVQFDSAIDSLKDHYVFKAPKTEQDVIQEAKQDLKRLRRKRQAGWDRRHVLDNILLNRKQERRLRLFKRAPPPLPAALQLRADRQLADSHIQKGLDIAKTLDIEDPIYMDQWHLYNPTQIGHDINVTGVWLQGITGKNSTVCIVDDGLDMDSEDLRDNYFAAGSHDFNDHVPEPKPRLSDDHHGTRCAGEIAAVRNDVCGVGVAYDSKVAGVRILSGALTELDEALALNFAYQENQIYSCSWGPPDDGQSMEAPGIIIKRAMVAGVQQGRQNLGSIFVFAIGNGAANDDNCNFDGYTNSIYSVSVGGIDRKGLHPYYSEKCSAQLVVTYSSGSGDAIHTTDVGANQCYVSHGGTSAAGPLVAGIYALVLEVRPDLTWRDIQWLTVLTAIPIDQPQDDWQDTPLGRRFSHASGYGKIDAYAIVEAAKNWTNVKPQAWFFSPWMHVRHAIPEGEQGIASSFEITEQMIKDANLERIEHVTVTMNVEHTRRGDLSVELRSPQGIVSYIATSRRRDEANSGYDDWTFMSVAHWGESGVGKWTVIVKDSTKNGHTGKFVDWHLKLFGESIDGAKQGLLPLPDEHDDDNHDIETTSVGGTTTSVDHPIVTGEPEGNPSDHIDRPVNTKVSVTTTPTAAEPTSEAIPEPTSEMTAKPTSNPDAEEDQISEKPQSNFLPSIFPTFGASKRTQVWIYGALALIAAFCTSLTIWYILTKRRRQRNARDEYEFEMLNEEDIDDDGTRANGANGMSAKAKGKRRAGELYDAFAEDSDEEDVFSVGDDEDHGHEDEHDQTYRDDAGDGRGSPSHGHSGVHGT
jgi:kexin